MPFENVNDASFFYYSSKHKEALARMKYAVQQRKLGVFLIGEYGTGKTFLSRVLKKFFPEGGCRFVFINNPRLQPLEFLIEVNYQLEGEGDIGPQPMKMELLRSIQRRLEDRYNKDIYTVIIVDEAQSIQDEDLFEEIRLLLNVQAEESALFTLILLGQPQIEEKIEKKPQFKQRLSIRYKLDALNNSETKEYIDHRLKSAGRERKIFSDLAYGEIFTLSKGMPRSINNICDLALFDAFTRKLETVDKNTIVHVGEDLGELTQDANLNNSTNNG